MASRPWEPYDKHPDEFTVGDTITVRPLGECVVTESRATGNYHNNLGWALTVDSAHGESVLNFTIHSLSEMSEKGAR